MKVALCLCLLGLVAMANSWDKMNPVTLGFVIDTTGSMGNDIRQVRAGVAAILRTHSHLSQNLFVNFVVAPYNDPHVPRPTVTNNPNVVMSVINRLRPRGGGDCPELAMAGLWNAVTHSHVGSIIFFFSDATAKDYRRWTSVRNLAVRKHITLVFVMTGCCRRCHSIGYRVYPALAHATRGALYKIPKGRVHNVLNFINAAVKNGLPVLRHLPKTFPALVRAIPKLTRSPCARRPCKGRGVACSNHGRSRSCRCHNRRAVYSEARGCRVPPTTTTPAPTTPAPAVTCMDMNGKSHRAGSVYTVDCVTYKCLSDGTEKEIRHLCVGNGGRCQAIGSTWKCRDGGAALTCTCKKDADGIYTLME